MGYEFTLRPSLSQGPSNAEQVFTCLEQVGTTTGKLILQAITQCLHASGTTGTFEEV